MKILIAEDDRTSRMILKAVLTKWGYDVIEAADGNETWSILQEKDAPRLLILDLVMPGISGETICRKLRETKPHSLAYIIILTSKRNQSDLVRGLDAGANDYIRKPFDRPELKARVKVGERVLELHEALANKTTLEELQAHAQPLGSMVRNNIKLFDEINRHIGYLEAMTIEWNGLFSGDRGHFDVAFPNSLTEMSHHLESLKILTADLLHI